MRGTGKYAALGLHEPLDALGGAVEAARERRHLVIALHLDPRTQVAGTELLDALVETFEPARHAPYDRIGADGYRDGEQNKHRKPGGAPLALGANHQPASVGKAQRNPRPPAGATYPAALSALEIRCVEQLACVCQQRAVGVVQ